MAVEAQPFDAIRAELLDEGYVEGAPLPGARALIDGASIDREIAGEATCDELDAAGAAAWDAAGDAAGAAARAAAGAAERTWQMDRLGQYLRGEVA